MEFPHWEDIPGREPAASAADPAKAVPRLRRQLEAIRRITAELYSATTWEQKERCVRDVAMEVLDAPAATVYLHDPNRNVLRFYDVVAPAELRGRLQGRE